MKTEVDIIRDLTERFRNLGTPFMLTGSIAMNYYAEPRMTCDIDIVILLGADKVQSLTSMFSKDYYIDAAAVGEAIRLESIFNLILSKLAWAKESRSEMQLKDVANLLRSGYDEDYLRKWAVVLNLENFLGEIEDG